MVKLKQIVDPKGKDTKTLEDTKENLVFSNTRLENELNQKERKLQ